MLGNISRRLEKVEDGRGRGANWCGQLLDTDLSGWSEGERAIYQARTFVDALRAVDGVRRRPQAEIDAQGAQHE